MNLALPTHAKLCPGSDGDKTGVTLIVEAVYKLYAFTLAFL